MKNVKHNKDYKDSKYHYKTVPSNKSNTIPSNNEIEKETEKVNLETKTLNCKNKINWGKNKW